MVTSLLHEIAHSRIASLRGYKLYEISLMPYGAVINCNTNFNSKDNIYIALAGPIFNLLIAVFGVSLWWIFPVTYNYTVFFVKANLLLAVFNFLPIFPLDGSRIVMSLSKNKKRTTQIINGISIGFGIFLLILCVVSIFFVFNINIGILGVFIVYGAILGVNKPTYEQMCKCTFSQKNYAQGVEEKHIFIYENMPLYQILEMQKNSTKLVLHILDSSEKEYYKLQEEALQNILEKNELSCQIGNCLPNKK
ncbi:MAG: hypothetical protein RR454_02715 [Clostridia bacterium]